MLVYLPCDDVEQTLARIAQRFPGAFIALDTYSRRLLQQQNQMGARRGIPEWQWSCDDPRSLERLGLSIAESARITRPPRLLRAELPIRYRYLLPLAAMRWLVFRDAKPDAHQREPPRRSGSSQPGT